MFDEHIIAYRYFDVAATFSGSGRVTCTRCVDEASCTFRNQLDVPPLGREEEEEEEEEEEKDEDDPSSGAGRFIFS